MQNPLAQAAASWAAFVQDAYEEAVQAGQLPAGAPPATATPATDPAHGDFTSNFCMAGARALKLSPRAIAQPLLPLLEKKLPGSFFSQVSVAGAGFLNTRLSGSFFTQLLTHMQAAGDSYGRSQIGQGRRVMVEFVSANPTGPMTLGNARGGVLGDVLASVLQAAGYDVWREFYLNDTGNQVDLFGRSVEARYIQQLQGEDAVAFPEDGYHGEYIRAFATAYIAEKGDALLTVPQEERRRELIAFALPRNVEKMKMDLERYGIRYDLWFAESALHESGYVADTLQKLTQRGHTYEKDGALWFKASELGCEKDEVLRKSNGFYTYYAVDIAYHRDKFEKRGFDQVIDAFGADHHGHTLRFAAGMKALGLDPGKLAFVLFQLVHLTRDGEVVRMSKRTGRAVTLSDLLDEIPRDAVRFFFNNRQSNSHLEFDMALAVRQDADNPVYYVQYAHARLCSLLAMLTQEGHAVPQTIDADLLTHAAERELMLALAAYPSEIERAAREREPFYINRYLIDLAGRFHRFYNACRVKDVEPPLLGARLCLCACTRQVLQNGLTLLGITAPVSM